MKFVFSEESEKKFESLLKKYPQKEAALLPTLWVAQQQFGYLPQEARKYVAERLELSLARVEAVVSFYTMYKTKPMGKYHVQVCRTISCALKGCDKVLEAIRNELGIREGETTSDGLFSFDHVECIAACGGAPAMQINFDYYENLNPERAISILKELKPTEKER